MNTALRLLLLVPALIFIFVPLALIVAAAYILAALALHIAVSVLWLPRGRRVLFVYSDSPLWKPYLKTEVLAHLPGNTVVLNWSGRARWPKISLAVWLFTVFAGRREFNPVALVFRPFAPSKVFRFWRAFRELKQGKPEHVQRVQDDLFAEIGRSGDG